MTQGLGFKKEVMKGIVSGFTSISIVVLIGSQLATGCQPSDSEHQTETKQEAVKEKYNPNGPGAVAKMRTYDVTAEKAEKGKKDFAVCAGCHGNEGEGKFQIAPTLNSRTFLEAASDEMLFDTIKNGREGTTMIAWGSSMKDEQIENVIVYLRSINKTTSAKLDESPLKGDVKEGGKLFADICAGCHGANGAGYEEIPVGTGIGRRGLLGKTSNGFLRYIGKHGKTATSMKPLIGAKTAVANLTDEQFDSVLKYLREKAW